MGNKSCCLGEDRLEKFYYVGMEGLEMLRVVNHLASCQKCHDAYIKTSERCFDKDMEKVSLVDGGLQMLLNFLIPTENISTQYRTENL